MMHEHPRNIARDFTTPTLAVVLVNLLWSFTLIWATTGLPAVLALAVFLNYLITRLDHCLKRVEKP